MQRTASHWAWSSHQTDRENAVSLLRVTGDWSLFCSLPSAVGGHALVYHLGVCFLLTHWVLCFQLVLLSTFGIFKVSLG